MWDTSTSIISGGINTLFKFNMLMFPAYSFILLLKNENCKFPHILLSVVGVYFHSRKRFRLVLQRPLGERGCGVAGSFVRGRKCVHH